jgi:hypothetical protein
MPAFEHFKPGSRLRGLDPAGIAGSAMAPLVHASIVACRGIGMAKGIRGRGSKVRPGANSELKNATAPNGNGPAQAYSQQRRKTPEQPARGDSGGRAGAGGAQAPLALERGRWSSDMEIWQTRLRSLGADFLRRVRRRPPQARAYQDYRRIEWHGAPFPLGGGGYRQAEKPMRILPRPLAGQPLRHQHEPRNDDTDEGFRRPKPRALLIDSSPSCIIFPRA